MATIAQELLKALKAAGARCVFGLPGDYALPFFTSMETNAILPLHTLSHEPGIGFASDGATRYGGGIGVAVATYGAGAMNLVNPVACAWAEHTPLVVISGAPGTREMDHGLMLHHLIKTPGTQMNVFREFTCDQVRLDNPVEAPLLIERVIRNCIKQSRPVYIEFPRDMVDVECEAVTHNFSRWPSIPPSLLAECAQDIASRLSKAQCPAMLAGSQVRRFGLEDHLFSLAYHWSMPLLTSFMGKGLFANKGLPHIGSYLGLAGDESLRCIIEESDLAFVLGVIPCDTNWGMSGTRIDEKRMILATADSVIVCGKPYAGLTLRALVPELQKITYRCPRDFPKPPSPGTYHPSSNRPLLADDIAAILANTLEKREKTMPIVADIGDCLFSAMDLPNLPLLASAYYATMGYAIPAALGLQAATGDRPVVLVGDGGFQMTGWELLNCRRYGWDPIVILFNNESWEMLRQFQPQSHYTRLAAAGYAAMADAMGGEGKRVSDAAELAEVLKDALDKRGKFQLIEAMLQPGDCTSTMKRYTNALKKNLMGKN